MDNIKLEPEVQQILDEVIKKTPDWSNWESHNLENALVDEGEYVKSEDVIDGFKELANKISSHYETDNTDKILFKVRLRLSWLNDHTQVGGYPDIYVYAKSDNKEAMRRLVYNNLDKLTEAIPANKEFRGIESILPVGLPLIIE